MASVVMSMHSTSNAALHSIVQLIYNIVPIHGASMVMRGNGSIQNRYGCDHLPGVCLHVEDSSASDSKPCMGSLQFSLKLYHHAG